MDVFKMPSIVINFSSHEGNIFYILASASQAIKINKLPSAEKTIIEMKNRVTNSQSYEEALRVIGKYVNILSEEGLI